MQYYLQKDRSMQYYFEEKHIKYNRIYRISMKKHEVLFLKRIVTQRVVIMHS